MNLDIILHIIEAVAIMGSFLVALKGYFPKATGADIELLKKDLQWHKEGLERLEKKIDKINDYLMEDFNDR